MVTEGSSAYNFEMFEPQKQRTQPQFKVVQNKKMERVRTRNFILKVATYVSVFLWGLFPFCLTKLLLQKLPMR